MSFRTVWPPILRPRAILGAHPQSLAVVRVEYAKRQLSWLGSRRREHAMKLKVLIYSAEEGGYWAKVPAIPGCVSQGETLEEVKANILDALEGCLAVREEMALQEASAVEEMEV